MKLILEGVLQSSAIVSICTCIFIFFIKKWRVNWKPTVILNIWCIFGVRLLICIPIVYWHGLIETIVNYFKQPFESPIKSSTSIVSMSVSHLNVVSIFIVWIAGIVLFLLINLVRFHRIMKKIMAESNHVSDLYEFSAIYDLKGTERLKKVNVRYCSSIKNPILTGVFKIYLFMPQRDLEDEDIKLMLTHEILHYKNNDLLIKHLFLITNAIHWFNPLVYLMQRHVTETIELACDYRAVKDMPKDRREEYMELLCYSTEKSQRIPSALFMSHSAEFLMQRLESIADVKTKKNRLIYMSFIIMLLFIIQPFVYIDVFSEPFEDSYLCIQCKNEEGIVQSETIPLTELYYSKNNGKVKNIGEEKSITLNPSDNIILYHNGDKNPLYFSDNNYIFIELNINGNEELWIQIGENKQLINKRLGSSTFYFKEKTVSNISIINTTSDISVLY